MTTISVLNDIHKKGFFGDYEKKKDIELIKISELKNICIFQIVKLKNSSLDMLKFDLDGLNFPKNLNCSSNSSTRILWIAPDSWLVVSLDIEFIKKVKNKFNESDFAFTDLSHSRAIIELEGKNIKEVMKKGCPFNFNEFKKNNCLNSTFNGIAIIVDMLEDDPNKIRIFSLRSFGESFYHSITDACLEFGYKGV
tara:strand:- start:91 stop:675 length:585 start_codon:yes stop_codon:yes gene_type:complete